MDPVPDLEFVIQAERRAASAGNAPARGVHRAGCGHCLREFRHQAGAAPPTKPSPDA